MTISTEEVLNPKLLLSVASTRAACCLGLNSSELSTILSAAKSEAKDDGELATNLLFVRLCRALDGYFLADLPAEREWLNKHISELNSTPLELMSQPHGLLMLVEFVEKKLLN